MKKRIIALLLLAALLLAGCGNDQDKSPVTQEKAQRIALQELGVEEKDAHCHLHVTTYNDVPCYSVHVDVGGESHEVVIDAATGEVLHVGESSH